MNRVLPLIIGIGFFLNANAIIKSRFHSNETNFNIGSVNTKGIKRQRLDLKFEKLSLSTSKLKQLVLEANTEFTVTSLSGIKIEIGDKKINPISFEVAKNVLKIDFKEDFPYDTCTFKITFNADLENIKSLSGDNLKNQKPLNLKAFAFKAQPQKTQTTQAQIWHKQNDIINGWDWSLPKWVKAADHASSLGNIKLPVTQLASLNYTWRQLEPQDGVYRFDLLEKKLEELKAKGLKAQMHLRASEIQTKFTNKDGTFEIKPGNAPLWLDNYGVERITWNEVKAISTPFQITSFNIYDPKYIEKFKRMLKELAKTNILNDPAIEGIYLHGTSATRGEEVKEGMPLDSKDGLAWKSIMLAWKEAMGKDIRKLAYPGRRDDWLEYAFSLGMGQRGGYVEMYLRDMEVANLGASIDDKGYVLFNDDLAPVKEGRIWDDENEEYADNWVPRFGDPLKYPHRFKESWMRALQSRRISLWTGPHTYDPEFSYWTGMELARKADDSPDAWSYLRESYIKGPKEVKNFERWLYQRDLPKYPTEAVFRVDHGYKAVDVDLDRQYDLIGRKGKKFGFGVDDNFISPKDSKSEVAIKLTYQDIGKGKLFLNYNINGEDKLESIDMNDTGLIKTATFFLNGANFNQTDYKPDFYVYALDNDKEKELILFFTRIIKTNDNK